MSRLAASSLDDVEGAEVQRMCVAGMSVFFLVGRVNCYSRPVNATDLSFECGAEHSRSILAYEMVVKVHNCPKTANADH